MTPRPMLSPAATANYCRRPANAQVDLVVLHTTEGSATGALAWFANPAARVSAHYLVGRSGQLWQMVPEDFAAWHAGNWKWNARSIGIEVEGHADSAGTWTAEAVDALVSLLADVCRRHDIPATRARIVGHAEVPDPSGKGYGGAGNHTDPGPHCPWARIVAAVAAQLNPPEIA